MCNGGLLAGSLAIAETDPEYAKFIVPHAVKSLPKALHAYDPDGAWMEGPGYWHYATRYTAYGLCALQDGARHGFWIERHAGPSRDGAFSVVHDRADRFVFKLCRQRRAQRAQANAVHVPLAHAYRHGD